MATPNLNAEIVRLRQRIGDRYRRDGSEILAANVFTPNVSDDGYAFTKNEVYQIWNESVRDLLKYVAVTPNATDYAHEWIPGYIVTERSIAFSRPDVQNGDYNAYYYDLESTGAIRPLKILSISVTNTGVDDENYGQEKVAVYFPPKMLGEICLNVTSAARNSYRWTIAHTNYTGSTNGSSVVILMFPPENVDIGNIVTFSITYLQTHTDLVNDNTTPDLNLFDITDIGRDMVIDFCEKRIMRLRNYDQGALIGQATQENIQLIGGIK